MLIVFTLIVERPSTYIGSTDCLVTFSAAKLRKKLVKNNGFGKINAIRPKIKARRGRTRKFELGQKANWGGLVKELGFQIVTSFSHLLHLCDDINQGTSPDLSPDLVLS